MSKHRRTKACEIPRKVKERVYERDCESCVRCGRHVDVSNACAHYISRSHGGLGIEENVLTLCPDCHEEYDHSTHRLDLKKTFGAYLSGLYEDWDEDELVYHKWGVME